ncbi:MAG TPA: polysaccharide deacetylase family protein [Kribbella sp.]
MVVRFPPKAHRRYGGPIVVGLVFCLIAAVGTAVSGPPPPKQTTSPPAAAPQVAAPPAKFVFLTFDDGPDPRYTPHILDILDAYGAKATFFEVGHNVTKHPELTRRVHQRGHSVQNHTWSHVDLRKLSWAAFRDQIQTTDEAITAQTGETPRCLRPPYGGMNSLVTKRTTTLGKKVELWSVDSRDWKRPGTAAIVNRVLAGARNGSVILMHDGGGNRSQTIAALPTILKTLKARGYAFLPTSCA